ncbi:homocysteine S-methyltransferase [Streptococcus sanguinis]|uniref:S-methylmethionine:homocysteine methyltransferase n=1 Tax=Streptococcus sanguinis TaxID=1305 RepID=A0A859EP02_STRSA|nr:homocysteine S-methyltransferase [Streptococcus sanguinis]EFX93854.1 homocysteine S-methyltransferase [Streptococcus sanguinis VMC66]QKQ43912.1 homocysteine S-methyltransferase [Streptococcus sanguinis]
MGKFKDLLEKQEIIILDGALGTELESLSYDVSGKLWSAQYLLDQPRIIQDVHESYVRAGSDIITTSSYQASIPAFIEAGLTPEKGYDLLKETVFLAQKAIENVWTGLSPEEQKQRPCPLVAGSVGPYAAYLADGSEYTGNYQLSEEEYRDFHRPRIQALLEAGSDLLAIETIPNGVEAAAILRLLAEEFPQAEAYLSFVAQSENAISDGTKIEELGNLAQESPQVLAVGFNCTAPHLIASLLGELGQVCNKPFLTYPNSGETYNGLTKTWHDDPEQERSLLENSKLWQNQGVRLFGGCCRTRPEDIAQLAKGFKG